MSGSSELSPQSLSKSQKYVDGMQRLLVGHRVDPAGQDSATSVIHSYYHDLGQPFLTLTITLTLSHKTETVNFQDRDETETFHFFQTLKTETRPRRSIFPNSQNQDETIRSTFKTEARPKRSKRHLETAVSQFKNTNL